MIREDEVDYWKVHTCTHGWPERSRQRKTQDDDSSRKPRPFQRIRATACPFGFVIWLFSRKSLGKWQLEVCRGFFHHNHEVSANTYNDFPVTRDIRDPVVQAETNVMIEMGVKRSKTYDHLLASSQNVTLRDVENTIQRARQDSKNLSDNDATAEVGTRFASEDADNVITVAETDVSETGVVSLMSKYTRELYTRFPELLLVDTTHKTNRFANGRSFPRSLPGY